MNIRREMFRFWILFTVAWVIGCGAWAYSELTSKWVPQLTYVLPGATEDIYQIHRFAVEYALKKTHDTIELPHNVTVLVPASIPKDVTERRIRTFYAATVARRPDELRQRKFDAMLVIMATMFCVPAAIFIVGYALGWALVGFCKTA